MKEIVFISQKSRPSKCTDGMPTASSSFRTTAQSCSAISFSTEHCQPRDCGSAEKLGVITIYRTNGSRPEATFENHALPRNAHLARTSTDGHSTHCGCESRAEH